MDMITVTDDTGSLRRFLLFDMKPTWSQSQCRRLTSTVMNYPSSLLSYIIVSSPVYTLPMRVNGNEANISKPIKHKPSCTPNVLALIQGNHH